MQDGAAGADAQQTWAHPFMPQDTWAYYRRMKLAPITLYQVMCWKRNEEVPAHYAPVMLDALCCRFCALCTAMMRHTALSWHT